MERKEAVTIFFERIKQAYIEDRKAKGILASGKTDQLFKIQLEETGGSLLGPDYFQYQKIGRRPGKFPPIEAIIQWLKDKKTFQITDERGPGLKGLAFAIARKIAKNGTDIYMKKRPGVDIAQRQLDARKELANNLLEIEKQKIIDSIKKVGSIILLIIMSSCASLSVNGYKVKDPSAKCVTKKDRNIMHISFVLSFSVATHLKHEHIK